MKPAKYRPYFVDQLGSRWSHYCISLVPGCSMMLIPWLQEFYQATQAESDKIQDYVSFLQVKEE